MEPGSIEVFVNGKAIELNNFARAIVSNTVLGMVSALRLEEEPSRVEIRLEVKKST